MLDPVICAGMTIGAPRVDLAALVELERLLIGTASLLKSSGASIQPCSFVGHFNPTALFLKSFFFHSYLLR
jgi:hypothetical protein